MTLGGPFVSLWPYRRACRLMREKVSRKPGLLTVARSSRNLKARVVWMGAAGTRLEGMEPFEGPDGTQYRAMEWQQIY